MKKFLSRFFAFALVLMIGVSNLACSAAPSGFTGNYREDTLSLITTLKTALEAPDNAPDKAATRKQAQQMISDFSSRYRRDGSYTKLSSYTTMRTALNSLAGHYSSYPNRPVPKKLKDRLQLEFNRIESALQRGS